MTRTLAVVILIVLGSLVAYGNTISGPFVIDDEYNITKNPAVLDPSNLSHPERLEQYARYRMQKVLAITRAATLRSLAINYRISGNNPRGFHLTNIFLHITNALLLFGLIRLIFNAPRLAGKTGLGDQTGFSIAALCALLFAMHPALTMSVAYISARSTVLAGSFILLTSLCYCSSRLIRHKPYSYALYALALIFAVFAMKSRESAISLPIAIMAMEILFFEGAWKNRAMYLLPFLLTMAIIPISLATSGTTLSEIFSLEITTKAFGMPKATAYSYLINEPRVIFTYFRLLLLPVNLNIAHDYPLSTRLASAETVISALAIIMLMALAASYYFRSDKRPLLRLLAFGGLWFFICLSVESSVVAINSPINESRLYLPSIGFFLSVITLSATVFTDRHQGQRIPRMSVFTVLAGLLILSMLATISRNAVWGNEVRLWEDAARKSPNNPYVLSTLGNAYLKNGQFSDTIAIAKHALKLSDTLAPSDQGTITGMLNYILGSSYIKQQEFELAEQYLMQSPPQSETFVNLSTLYGIQTQYDKALGYAERAIETDPYNAIAWNNLGLVFASKKDHEKALRHYRRSLEIDPSYSIARFNLVLSLIETGSLDEAQKETRVIRFTDPALSRSLPPIPNEPRKE